MKHGTSELVVEHGRPFVELEFAGTSRRARALLDTGGGPFLIGAALGRDLGLTPEDREERGSTFPVVTLPEVRVGGARLLPEGRVARIRETDVLHEGFGNEAFVPATVLAAHDVVFDYPGGQIALDPGDEPRGSQVPVLSAPRPGWPAITVTIAGEEVSLLLDTGASCCMFSERLIERLEITGRTKGAFGLANMSAGSWEASCETLRFPDLIWGDVHFPSVIAVSRPEGNFEGMMSSGTPVPVVGAIAGNVLRHLRLDWRHSEQAAWIECRDDRDDPLTQIPLTLHASQGRLLVVGLGDTAAGSGVRVGDELQSVDDVRVSSARFGDAVTLLSGGAGTTKMLRLVRDEGPVEIVAEVVVVV